MTTLPDPREIPLTHQSFRTWYQIAGVALAELDEQHYDVLTRYWINGNTPRAEIEREADLYCLKLEAQNLKDIMEMAWGLWCQLRHEID